MRQAGGLLSHPDALQVDGEEHQLLVRKFLVPCVAHVIRNAAGTLIMFAAVPCDQRPEHLIVGIVLALLFALKHPLRKKAQMHVKRLKSSASRSKWQP